MNFITNILRKCNPKNEGEFIAVDMGSSYIKSIYIKGGRIEKHLITPSQNEPASIISKWLKKEGLSSKNVKIALKGPQTIIRYITFPKVDKKKLKEAISYEISNFIPFPKEDIYFDINILDDNHKGKDFLLFLAAVKKELLVHLLAKFKDFGGDITQITLNNAALINLFLNSFCKQTFQAKHQTSGELLLKENVAIIDIGFETTLLNLINKKNPCLSREIKIAATNIISAASPQKSLFTNNDNDLDLKDSPETIAAIEDIIGELSDEIKNSLDYFEVNWGEKINKIYLTGGIIKIEKIKELIEKNLVIETKIWNPFENVTLEVNNDILNHKNMFAVALGLTL